MTTEQDTLGSAASRSSRATVLLENSASIKDTILEGPITSNSRSFGPGLSFHTPERAPAPDLPRDQDVANETYTEWNVLSIIALAASTLALVLVFSAGTFTGLGFLFLLGFVLGLIGLIQAGTRHQKGKGFAIAAMAIPIALLAIILAALNAWSGQV